MALSAHAGRHTVPDRDTTPDRLPLEPARAHDEVLRILNHEVGAAPLLCLSFTQQSQRSDCHMRRERPFRDRETAERAGPGSQRLELRNRDGMQHEGQFDDTSRSTVPQAKSTFTGLPRRLLGK